MTMRILPLFLLFFATLPCARAQPDASQAERCVRPTPLTIGFRLN
jgi:hypothetical protein